MVIEKLHMITSAARIGGAVLVVGLYDGPMLQARGMFFLPGRWGYDRRVVFLNKCDIITGYCKGFDT